MSEERKNAAQQEREALEAACARAFDGNEVLIRHLRKIAMAGSFAPGRAADQVAFAEGKRALAVYLLTLGGKYDGRSGREFDD